MLWYLIKLPFLLIASIFSEHARHDLLEPLDKIVHFLLTAPFTLSLALVCFLSSLYGFWLSYNGQDALFQSLMWQPSLLLGWHPVALFAHLFLHASIAHLLGNLLFLLVFGRVVERNIGWRVILVFLLAGVFASLSYSAIHLALGGSGYLLGASGAIMGLVATAILFEPFYISFVLILPLPIMAIGLLQLFTDALGVLTPTDNIAHLAHIMGFASVTLVVWLLARERKKLLKGLLVNVAAVVALLVWWFVSG